MRRFFMINFVLLGIALSLVLALRLCLTNDDTTGNTPSPVWAYAAVPEGMPTDEAIAILNTRAWLWQHCADGCDLFFFDSHDYDKATIVIMDSHIEDGEYRVGGLGWFEPYMWHSCYADCIDESLFD